ncbi:MAG: hypothetical protein ACNA7X_02340 [Dehalococcoidia bacterium]
MRHHRCRSTSAGVLCIIAGAGQVGLGTVLAVAGALATEFPGPQWLMYVGIGVAVLGIVSIAGGVSALKRRRWALALAGSICALVAGNIGLAIPAIALLSLGKEAFDREAAQWW